MRYGWFVAIAIFFTAPAYGEGSLWVKEWLIGLEVGGGLSTLFSDRSVGLLASGLGRHIGISGSTRRSQELGLKVRFDRFWLQDWTVGTNSFSEFGSSRIEYFDRGYSVLGVGVEGRKNEDHAHWVWDLTLGLAATSGGEVGLQSTSAASSQMEVRSVTARSQVAVGASYGYRKKMGENWFLTGSLRTLVLFPPIFDGPMGGKLVFGLPALFSFSLERQL